MIYNFCTLFDRNYLYKGLAMHDSLAANCKEDFILWILCMDDVVYGILEKINLPKVRLIALSEFESPELLKVKAERSVAEYSWTCASNFLWYLIKNKPDIGILTYLDADLYFFSDPKVLLDELGDDSVLITSHRYTEKYDQAALSGKYCVQFMVFKNNLEGLAVLDWWRQACLNWCYNTFSEGRFGDQKYLDDWTTRFKGVHELGHLGGGVAPWNVQQYHFFKENNRIIGREISSGQEFPLIFYHFHGFSLISDKKYLASIDYTLTGNVKNLIYKPYFSGIKKAIDMVRKLIPEFNYGFKRVSLKHKIYSFIVDNKHIEKTYSIIKRIIWSKK